MSQPESQYPQYEPTLAGIFAGTGTAQGGAVVHRTRPAAGVVVPTINPEPQVVVVVKKSYTNPARVLITLRASGGQAKQDATLTRIMQGSSGNIRLFDTLTGGKEITFTQSPTNPTESTLEIKKKELNAGKRLFAESDSPCSNLDDYRLVLSLPSGPGAPKVAEVTVVAVSLQLDISPPRTSPGAVLTPLPQPSAVPSPAPKDKWFGGLQINAQDRDNNQKRALLEVQVVPTTFKEKLILQHVKVSGTTIGVIDNKVRLFDDEIPGPTRTPPVVEVPKPRRFEFTPNTALPLGTRVFAEGSVASVAVRDTGFQVGVKGGEPDGDRVALTVAVAPVLTVDNPIIVVRKPHTSPARRVITVRASAAFGGTGTLTRSATGPAVRLLNAQQPAPGVETVVTGAGHIFSGLELTKGVELFAESTAPSGKAEDYELTLTLATGGAPVASPITIKLTAVELTLDVAVSRVSPGVTPPLLSAADKINIGRFVQVRDPGFSHERAMLILRPPKPAVALTTVLAATTTQVPAPAAPLVQAFGVEEPFAGQGAHNNPATFPTGILGTGFEVFVEATGVSRSARDIGFRYGIQNLEVEADRIAITAARIEITDTPAAAAAATFVRMGLWDNAFRPAGDPLGPLFNVAAEADNFAGADTRKFHLRVTDRGSQGAGHVQANWGTLDDHDNNLDVPATRDVTLVETPANSGVFVSRGLLLVSDPEDQNQSTHSGLAGALPDAGAIQARGSRNHRVRLASVRGSIKVEYKPTPATTLPIRLPVFERNPERRRRIPLQVFVLKVGAGPAGVVPTAPGSQIWNRDLRVAEETYARLGMEVETVVGATAIPADVREEQPFVQNENVHTTGDHAFKLRRKPVIVDPRNKVEVQKAGGALQARAIFFENDPRNPNAGEVKINRTTGELTFNAGEQPGAADTIVASYVVVGHRVVLIKIPAAVVPGPGGIVSLADEAIIGGAFPAQPDTIRVFYAAGLATFAAGESAPDIDFPGAPDVGTSFLDVGRFGLGTFSHEIGHVLTNKTIAAHTGHYVRPAAPAANRFHDPQNLMANLPSPAAGGATIRKRLWDVVDDDAVVNQFTDVRRSHYTRTF